MVKRWLKRLLPTLAIHWLLLLQSHGALVCFVHYQCVYGCIKSPPKNFGLMFCTVCTGVYMCYLCKMPIVSELQHFAEGGKLPPPAPTPPGGSDHSSNPSYATGFQPLHCRSIMYCLAGHFLTLRWLLPPACDDLHDVFEEVYSLSAKWGDISFALKLPFSQEENIRSETQGTSTARCLRLVLSKWLQKCYKYDKYGPPTWRMLVKAVGDPFGGNDCALAETIAKHHPGMYLFYLWLSLVPVEPNKAM